MTAMNTTVDEKGMRASIAALWGSALGVEPRGMDPEKTFFELGGYSLLAVQLAGRVAAELGIACPATAILQHDTLNAFCAYLDKTGPTAVAAPSCLPVPARDDRAAVGESQFALTGLQQAYWLGEHQHYELGGVAAWYTEYEAKELDIPRFARALSQLVERHPMLRVIFDEEAYQRIPPQTEVFPLQFEDLRGLNEREREACCTAVSDAFKRDFRPLEKGPHLSVAVLQLPDTFRVFLAGRLIVTDGRSGEVIAADLWRLYQGESLAPLGLTVPEYLQELQERRATDPAEQRLVREAEEYWRARLDTLPATPELPRRRSSGERRSPAPMRHLALELDPARWAALQANASQSGVTPTVAVCCAFAQVLAQWSGAPHFTLNIMYGNRQPLHPDVNSLVGCLSDTLLLEVRLGQSSFAADARALQKQLFSDVVHHQVSGVSVLRDLARARGQTAGQPLMPVVFASGLGLDPTADEEPVFFMERFGWRPLESSIQTPHVLLDHQVAETRGALLVQWDVRDELLPSGMAEAMFEGYRLLLDRLAEPTGAGWREAVPSLLPSADVEVRRAVNATEAPPSPVGLLHEGFARTARLHPNRTALVHQEQTLTYAELDAWVRRIAAELRSSGVERGELVGVWLPKSASQVAATLAVLFAGCAYVPLSVDAPERRNRQIVEQCQIRRVLALLGTDAVLGDGVRIIPVAGTPPEGASLAAPRHEELLQAPGDLAYVIFTSGTTGVPKGVAISHESALNTIVDVSARFGVTADERVLAVSELNFDLSVYDIFGTFLEGGCLVVPSHELAKNPLHLLSLVKRHGVTLWNSVPAFLEMVIEYCEVRAVDDLASLQHVFLSGDWIPIQLPGRLRKLNPRCELISMGGATEAAIWSNFHRVTEVDAQWTSIPYGVPLGGQSFHVLDAEMRDVPTWVPGELYIGGRGLARGYHANPEQTAERFIQRPGSGERLYRTGDWGRYWPDGSLEFLGRRDTQVKVRGHRIELGDIEAALVRQQEVKEAVVVAAKAGEQGTALVAFLTTQANADVRVILRRLEDELPAYMVPQRAHVVDHLPLTSNGKVDRKQLLTLAGTPPPATSRKRVPSTAAELLIAEVWRQVLGIERPTADDSFFDLGGDSITAIRMMNRLSARLGVELPMSLVYANPTLASLATALSQQSSTGFDPLVSLKEGTGKAALFCVHPVGGNIFCYRELSALWPGDVVGVQAVGTQTGLTPQQNVREMAALYADAVLRKQPRGPVRLLGWSMGGLIALEVARIMKRQNRESKVVLLDTWVSKSEAPSSAVQPLLAEFFWDLSGGTIGGADLFQGLGPDEGLKHGAALLREHGRGLDVDHATFTRLFELFAANSRALHAHAAYTTRVPTLLFTARDERSDRFQRLLPLASAPEWRDALPDLEICNVAADHFSIVSSDVLRTISGRITDFLEVS